MLILHGHHANNVLSELPSLEERVDFIKANKHEEEHAVRLSLIRALTAEEIAALPKDFKAACEKLDAACANRVAASAEWKEAEAELEAAQRAAAFEEWAAAQRTTAMQEWHKKVCGCNFYKTMNILTMDAHRRIK